MMGKKKQLTAVVLTVLLITSGVAPFADLSPVEPASADVSDNRDIISSTDATGALNNSLGIEEQNGYAYVASQGSNNLTVVDVRSTGNPKVVASITDEKFSDPSDVALKGDYAIVTSDNENVHSVDVSDPTNPEVADTVTDSRITDADGIFVDGDYAYVAFRDGLAVLDISNPASPSVTGVVEDSTNLGDAHDVVSQGDYAYLVGFATDTFATVDVSDPSNPTVVGSETDPAIENPRGVVVNNEVAYVASDAGSSMTVIDISDPTTPTATTNVTSGLDRPWDIEMDRNLGELYIADHGANSVTTINVSDPNSPEIVDQVQDNTALNGASTLYFSEGKAYVVASASERFTVTNVWELITGTVVNQHGAPVDNATLEVMGVNYDKLSPGSTIEKATEAENELREAARRKPTSWQEDLDLQNQFETFEGEQEIKYALATSGDVNADPPFLDSADLKSPKRKFATNQEIVLTVWQPVDGVTDGFRSNLDEYDQQQPGKIDDDTNIVIEQIGAKDDVIDRTIVATEETAGGGYLDPDSMQYATTQLSPGYYRIYPEGSPEAGYPIQVGSQVEIMNTWLPDIRDVEGQIGDSAKKVRDNLDQGLFERRFVTADSDGKFYASVPRNVKTVGLSSYTASGMELEMTGFPTQEKLRSLSADGYKGSFIMTPTPTITDAPASDVDVEVYEVQAPPYGNMSDFFNKSEWMDEYLDNLTNIRDQFQNQLTELQRQELERIYSELSGLIKSNDDLLDKYLDLSGRDSVPSASDLSIDELREEIRYMQNALSSTSPGIPGYPPDPPVTGNQTVSMEFPFQTDLSPEHVSVFVHWSNGTTEVVPMESEHVHIEDRFRTDVVVIDDYPLPEDGPATADFEVKVANEDGIGESRTGVKNPGFDGNVPGLDSISLSTMHPGPTERVNLTLNPEADSGYRNLTSMTVYGPEGSTVTSNVTGAKTAVFETNGEGVYLARATFTNHDGDEFTIPIRVEAGDQDVAMPGTIRLSESPLGTHVVVADGFEDGSVDVERGGSEVHVMAQVPSDQDPPSEIRVFTTGLTHPPDTSIDLNVVRGNDQEQISRVSKVAFHTSRLPENALVYRSGSQPLTDSASTQYGTIERNSNGSVVKSYTDGDGTVEIRTNAHPSLVDRGLFYIRVKTAGISLPSPLTIFPWADRPPGAATAGMGLLGAGLAAGALVTYRRRRED
jgi:hypothetical protein